MYQASSNVWRSSPGPNLYASPTTPSGQLERKDADESPPSTKLTSCPFLFLCFISFLRCVPLIFLLFLGAGSWVTASSWSAVKRWPVVTLKSPSTAWLWITQPCRHVHARPFHCVVSVSSCPSRSGVFNQKMWAFSSQDSWELGQKAITHWNLLLYSKKLVCAGFSSL